jgi:hypothetical protein
MGLSPDGQRVLAIPVDSPDHIDILPVGPGHPQTIRDGSISVYEWAGWVPGRDAIVFTGRTAGDPSRTYLRELPSGPPRAITPTGVAIWNNTVSPDGRHLAAPCGDGVWCVYPLAGGEPRAIPALGGEDAVVGWSGVGRLLVSRGRLPTRIFHLDLAAGTMTLWTELAPPDRAGVVGVSAFSATPDGSAYAYSFSRSLCDLYVVEGLR